MDNLAYLYVASAYEEPLQNELINFNSLLKNAPAPDWRRLSGKAWKYMLPLLVTLSTLSAVTSVLALERGDQGPSVRSLQQRLKNAGFYQAPITQVYDFDTEAAVRSFQKAVGLQVNGIAGSTTLQKLENWQKNTVKAQSKKTSTASTQIKKVNNASTPSKKTSTVKTQSPVARTVNNQTQRVNTLNTSTNNKRRSPNLLQKGDEGEQVRILQERLRVAGFYFGQSTGIFGPITEEAVKRFQVAYKLDVDGVAGPNTLRKLPPLGVGGTQEVAKPVKQRDNLSQGDRGEPVRVLQEQLIQAGYLQGEPNGYYGPYTADAVRRFQADNFLAVSGIAGPTTRAKLHNTVKTAAKSEFEVLEIQRRLRDRGFYKGALNGVMGDETKRAIKLAQEFYGVSLGDVRSGRF
ncbi:peptidoglycan-binding domain-containing protein [Chlorogloeopsis sp. ULAP02]|uniref:peptidoglycan-binding domain-containing protein n=1 Tax=Chlorogloeopsis sp. ULAP02 TaxID=3107926 RepID=UPI00313758F9